MDEPELRESLVLHWQVAYGKNRFRWLVVDDFWTKSETGPRGGALR